MGQAESSPHVPNALLGWRSRIEASHTYSCAIVKATSWKLNSIASLSTPPYTLFAASGALIFCYNIQAKLSVPPVICILKAGAPEDDTINQIRVLKIAGLEMLVAVFNSGLICIWNPLDLTSKPMKLQNDMESSWSLSADPLAPYLFIGSNGHRIARFTLSAEHVQATRTVVASHDHNVPCIDVSPCGQYLASTSIDATVRITHLPSMTPLSKIKLSQWGWSCIWIRKSEVQLFSPTDQISWLTQIFTDNPTVPTLENVDIRHYEAIHEDVPVEREAQGPPTKKRILNMEDVQLENIVDFQMLEEDEEDFEEDLDHMEVEENGFAEVEEDGEVEDFEVPPMHRAALLALRELEEDDVEEVKNPFRQLEESKEKRGDRKDENLNSQPMPPEDYLLFGATFDELYLFDGHLDMLSRLSRPLPRLDESSTVLHMVERFMMLFWIPEWSIVLATNQGIATVLLATIRYNTHTCSYDIVPELSLPAQSERNPETHVPLSGFSCYRVDRPPTPAASPSKKATSSTDTTSKQSTSSFFYRLHLQLEDLVTYDLHLADDGSIHQQRVSPAQLKQDSSRMAVSEEE